MANQDKYKHQQQQRQNLPSIASNTFVSTPESLPDALQPLYEPVSEVIDEEPETNQYESLYEAVVSSLGAGGKSVLGLASITGVVEADWKNLTPDQQKDLSARVDRLAAMSQVLSATVREYLIYSGSR